MNQSDNKACSLSDRKCVPCMGGVPPLKGDALTRLFEQLPDGWTVVDQHHLVKEFNFKDFREALAFTNHVGELAEEQGHHPDIHLAWGKVRIEVWTHKIDGLTESDFIFAAKTDTLSATKHAVP
ncbi:MAG: 4a-hydroxytetrahydrobiopterin dehydratase [Planctomycetota bacterium]|nr:MAG: 4a-hydroxytetrahydrobiopterin dehydratase [Planctomycetota bacterium]